MNHLFQAIHETHRSGSRIKFKCLTQADGGRKRWPRRAVVPNPFDRWSWRAASYWATFTHYVSLPYIVHFKGAPDLFNLLLMPEAHLRAVSANMNTQNRRDLVMHQNLRLKCIS